MTGMSTQHRLTQHALPRALPRFRNRYPVLAVLTLSVLYGCGMHPKEGVTPGAEKDGPPLEQRDFQTIANPVPRIEALSRYGNHTPYQVFGKTYHVLDTAADYDEIGLASWYGRKFAGRPTSSMEPYDPYALTAAHRSLPLPSYARVTNLDNGREIIVRINDRGPFHSDRIIDLSYAAAGKLGFVEAGTAKVRVTVIAHPHAEPELKPSVTPKPAATQPALSLPDSTPTPTGYYLQVGAFTVPASAQALQATLAANSEHPVSIVTTENPALHRVRIGPFPDEYSARHYQERLRRGEPGYGARDTTLIKP